jgi:hypothetical protein
MRYALTVILLLAIAGCAMAPEGRYRPCEGAACQNDRAPGGGGGY